MAYTGDFHLYNTLGHPNKFLVRESANDTLYFAILGDKEQSGNRLNASCSCKCLILVDINLQDYDALRTRRPAALTWVQVPPAPRSFVVYRWLSSGWRYFCFVFRGRFRGRLGAIWLKGVITIVYPSLFDLRNCLEMKLLRLSFGLDANMIQLHGVKIGVLLNLRVHFHVITCIYIKLHEFTCKGKIVGKTEPNNDLFVLLNSPDEDENGNFPI